MTRAVLTPADLVTACGSAAAAESAAYVLERTPFHLHTLLTEQPHPRTEGLSYRAHDTLGALQALWSVDDDIAHTLARWAAEPAPLQQAADAMAQALRVGHRVVLYGCGATGRLCKQIESGMWRPFLRRLRASPWGARLPPAWDSLESRLIGEMTGGDRALISSLEGFEDLAAMGALQMQAMQLTPQDVICAVTEGGETSSVIGALLYAHNLHAAHGTVSAERLYFVYNNPDAVLMHLERSREVLTLKGITRLCLATGPQAIAGSTRMQAATIDTYVLGVVVETALAQLLAPLLPSEALNALGLQPEASLSTRLGDFAILLQAVKAAGPALTPLVEHEAACYRADRSAVVLAERGVIAAFTDITERSPTFRLPPLERSTGTDRSAAAAGTPAPSPAWVHVGTASQDAAGAFATLLGRPVQGLDVNFYGPALTQQVPDAALRATALRSLPQATTENCLAYDLSFAAAAARMADVRCGLCLGIFMGDEARGAAVSTTRPPAAAPLAPDGARLGLRDFFLAQGVHPHLRLAAIVVDNDPTTAAAALLPQGLTVPVQVPACALGLRQQVALKLLLNAHSALVMAQCGRLVGNTMSHVQPGNLKLIGRATFLIQLHINRVLTCPSFRAQVGEHASLTYAQANTLLYAAIQACQKWAPAPSPAEVHLSIVYLLDGLRQGAPRIWDAVRAAAQSRPLADYLQACCPTSSD